MRGINWEVGSTWFAEDPKFTKSQPVLSDATGIEYLDGSRFTLLSTCRSAIGCVLDKIRTEPPSKTKRVLLPGFTCHSVIEPFLKREYIVDTYDLNEDLTINIQGLQSKVDHNKYDVALFHGYFGLHTLAGITEFIDKLQAGGSIIVEDLTQTMFSEIPGLSSDYSLGSLRKWFPIADGAFVDTFLKETLIPDLELEKEKLAGLKSKGEYILNGKGLKSEFLKRQSRAEEILDSRCKPYSISPSSYQYLRATEIELVKSQRRRNYAVLSDGFSGHEEIRIIRPLLRGGEVPFQLPVLIESGREDLQKFMASHNVYPTVIWKCPEEIENKIDENTRRIYKQILCFHVDQRYDETDMGKVVEIMDKYYGK